MVKLLFLVLNYPKVYLNFYDIVYALNFWIRGILKRKRGWNFRTNLFSVIKIFFLYAFFFDTGFFACKFA